MATRAKTEKGLHPADERRLSVHLLKFTFYFENPTICLSRTRRRSTLLISARLRMHAEAAPRAHGDDLGAGRFEYVMQDADGCLDYARAGKGWRRCIFLDAPGFCSTEDLGLARHDLDS